MTEERAAAFAEHARRYAGLGWVLLRLNGKRPRRTDWQKTAFDAAELAAGKWSHWGQEANMGVLLGASSLAVVEPDTPAAHAKLLELLGGDLPKAPIVQSGGKSLHLYFLDGGQGNAERDGLELRAGAQQVVVPPSVHPDTGRPYRWLEGHEPWARALTPVPAELLAYFADRRSNGKAGPVAEEIREPGRHRALLSIAGTMRRRGLGLEEILAALRAVNTSRCRPPLPDEEVVELAADVVRRYEPAPPDPEQEELRRQAQALLDDPLARARVEKAPKAPKAPSDSPDNDLLALLALLAQRKLTEPALDVAALHGPAGAWAIACQPYTEASVAGVLVATLVAVGNAIGRTPMIEIGGTRHYVNEYALLVGATGTGRKGDAMNIGRRPVVAADLDWRERVHGGFGSGEAIVFEVRDAQHSRDEEGEEKLLDEGSSDKRLLVLEAEFGHVIAVASREGSTLSALLRAGWDGNEPLANRTKRSRIVATNAHVSVLAAITAEELVRNLPETEAANGFLNRFLLAYVERSKLLPSPPAIPLELDEEYRVRFAHALASARKVSRLSRARDAEELWREVYVSELAVERRGLAGAVCSRAEAHALRLSMLYALLDGSEEIRLEHIRAALALWRYCEASARQVFGGRLGDPDADVILFALAEAGAGGLTRTEINSLFGRHRHGRIAMALALLLERGLVVTWKQATGGRPEQRFRLAPFDEEERHGYDA